MKRDDLIEAMWFQTDLDDVDVPVFNAKMFLTEAFERTAAVERHWPLYETVWTYNVTAGDATVALDADTSFSVWGQQLYLWPVPSSDTVLTVRGWRKPDPTWIEDPALEVDLDSRLHLPLLHYGIALVYAQQEDGELENQYMRRWAQSIADLKKDILRPSTYRPVVLNGGEDQHLYGGRSTWSRVGFDNL